MNQTTSRSVTHLNYNDISGDVYNFKIGGGNHIRFLYPVYLLNTYFTSKITYHNTWTMLFEPDPWWVAAKLKVSPILARWEFFKAQLKYWNTSKGDFFAYNKNWDNEAHTIFTEKKETFDDLEKLWQKTPPTQPDPHNWTNKIKPFQSNTFNSVSEEEANLLRQLNNLNFSEGQDEITLISPKDENWQFFKNTILDNKKYFEEDFIRVFEKLTDIDEPSLNKILETSSELFAQSLEKVLNIKQPENISIGAKRKSPQTVSNLENKLIGSSPRKKLKTEITQMVPKSQEINPQNNEMIESIPLESEISDNLTKEQWDILLTTILSIK